MIEVCFDEKNNELQVAVFFEPWEKEAFIDMLMGTLSSFPCPETLRTLNIFCSSMYGNDVIDDPHAYEQRHINFVAFLTRLTALEHFRFNGEVNHYLQDKLSEFIGTHHTIRSACITFPNCEADYRSLSTILNNEQLTYLSFFCSTPWVAPGYQRYQIRHTKGDIPYKHTACNFSNELINAAKKLRDHKALLNVCLFIDKFQATPSTPPRNSYDEPMLKTVRYCLENKGLESLKIKIDGDLSSQNKQLLLKVIGTMYHLRQLSIGRDPEFNEKIESITKRNQGFFDTYKNVAQLISDSIHSTHYAASPLSYMARSQSLDVALQTDVIMIICSLIERQRQPSVLYRDYAYFFMAHMFKPHQRTPGLLPVIEQCSSYLSDDDLIKLVVTSKNGLFVDMNKTLSLWDKNNTHKNKAASFPDRFFKVSRFLSKPQEEPVPINTPA